MAKLATSVDVVAHGGTVLARLASGEIRCWGRNDLGQCGLGRTESPIRVPEGPVGIDDVTAIGLGDGHACIARASGGVFCTGRNDFGQLGIGSVGDPETTFTRVVGIP